MSAILRFALITNVSTSLSATQIHAAHHALVNQLALNGSVTLTAGVQAAQHWAPEQT
jgi:hypothetical protein